MDDLEQKLNQVLNDPKMLQKLMNVAQSLGAPPGEQPKPEESPNIDLGMLQKLTGMAQSGSIDQNQQNLLRALRPYLSRNRIEKLEKAMRAAGMAKLASGFFGPGGFTL